MAYMGNMDLGVEEAGDVTPYQIFKTIVFTVDIPLNALAHSVGVSRSEAWRLSRLAHHRPFDKFCACVGLLGIGLMARAKHVPTWCVLAVPEGHVKLPVGTTIESLLKAAIELKKNNQHTTRHSRKRMERGEVPPIVRTMFSLLSGCGGELIAIGGDGSIRSLQLTATLVPKQTSKQSIPPSVRTTRTQSKLPSHGRLKVSKGEVFALYSEQGHHVRAISKMVGVCEERVRKILAYYGVSLSSQRRQNRIKACRASEVSAATTKKYKEIRLRYDLSTPPLSGDDGDTACPADLGTSEHVSYRIIQQS